MTYFVVKHEGGLFEDDLTLEEARLKWSMGAAAIGIKTATTRYLFDRVLWARGHHPYRQRPA